MKLKHDFKEFHLLKWKLQYKYDYEIWNGCQVRFMSNESQRLFDNVDMLLRNSSMSLEIEIMVICITKARTGAFTRASFITSCTLKKERCFMGYILSIMLTGRRGAGIGNCKTRNKSVLIEIIYLE